MQSLPNPDKTEMLAGQIQGFLEYYWRLHVRCSRMNTAVILLGIILGLAVTAAGFLGYGMIAGLLGLGVTLFVSLQNAFNLSDKADFYRVIHNEAKILRDRLRYRVHSEKDFDDVIESFGLLRRHAAEKLPKGKGIEVVKEIHAKYSPEVSKSKNV
jgi:hypothetical protein